jgi:hypothetical protein
MPAASRLPLIWVGNDSTSADLLQISVTDGQVSGTLDETDIDSTGQNITPHHLSVSGSLSGTALSLTIGSGLGQTTLTGTVTGATMTLNVPSQNGTISSLSLAPGSISSYNTLVAALQGTAASAVQQQQQQAATDAQQQAIDKAASSVQTDYTTLSDLVSQGIDFSGFRANIKTAKSDLAKTHADATTAKTQGKNSDGCYTASNAEYDASNVAYDQSSIQYDNTQLASSLQAIGDAGQQLKDDWAAYQNAAAAQPGYHGQTVPTPQDIATLQNTATSDVTGWDTKGKSYQSQVDGMHTEAQNTADDAQTATC